MNNSFDTFPTAQARELLSSTLQYMKGVGPMRAELLARLNLKTVQDTLYHFPVTHKDRASVTPIARLKAGEDANVVAQIIDVACRRYLGKQKIEALLQDQSGQIRAAWWNPYVAEKLAPNAWAFFSGKTTLAGGGGGGRRELSNADFEILSGEEEEDARQAETGPSFGRIVPIYNLRPKMRLAEGQEPPEIKLRQNFLRKLVWQVLESAAPEQLEDQLPEELRRKLGLMPLAEAVRQFHFPDSFETAHRARERLAFEELFVISVGVALRRAQIEHLSAAKTMPLSPAIRRRIEARLPFKLTPSQEQAFREIAADLAGERPMNRLLQGDVGSGKTAVAVSALLLCVAHGSQAALLAPTEVLAEQHARTLKTMLADSRVNIGLLRGGASAPARRQFLESLANGETHIAVGTHALLEEDVRFKSLGLVVVDEQHKFGVAQRMTLRAKGRAPHVLVMTATPIPRTLTLTLYGDLDVSVISQPPPGRGEIVTRWVKEAERSKVYRLIQSEAKQGHASYVVLPRIDAESSEVTDTSSGGEGSGFRVQGSGLMTTRNPEPGTRNPSVSSSVKVQQKLWSEVKGVEDEARQLKEHLPTLRIATLHGRMGGDEKEAVLQRLRDGKLDVLVSTLVIEVGIDLPTATVMLIENAERFGLSALHQLRGRVGRSERQSHCLIFSAARTDEAVERLKTFVETKNGFDIAEADFRLRGPGQFFGTQQTGMSELKVADLLRDGKLLAQARREAFELVGQDPALKLPDHAGLKRRVAEVLGGRLRLVDVG